MTVKCIDISHWQDFPDFSEVRDAGVIAMIHKATEGTGYQDPNRATNIANATRAGIACCTYHWLSPGNDAREQMQYYMRVVDPVDGERMVIDYEENGCSLSQLKEAVQALMDDDRNLRISVYSGHLLKEQLGSKNDSFLADNTDLWLAEYQSASTIDDISWPDGTYESWTLHQYSETGEVDGIDDSYVDLNRFDGSDVELLQWISPGVPPPIEPPQEVTGEVTRIRISGPAKLRISVNGTLLRPVIRRPARHGPDAPR